MNEIQVITENESFLMQVITRGIQVKERIKISLQCGSWTTRSSSEEVLTEPGIQFSQVVPPGKHIEQELQ